MTRLPPIHIPCVAILGPGAELASFEKSKGLHSVTVALGNTTLWVLREQGSGMQVTGGSTQGGKAAIPIIHFRLTVPRVRKTNLSWTGRKKGKDSDSLDGDPADGDSPDDRNESYAASSSGPRSFKTVSPTTITRGIDSRVTVSSSVVVASVMVVRHKPDHSSCH